MAGLESTQQIVFTVLAQKKVFFPVNPYHVSYNDFSKGLPNLILIWELTVVAVFFLWSFSFEEYIEAARLGTPVQASARRTLLQSCNTLDVFDGCAYAITGWHRKAHRDVGEVERAYDLPETAQRKGLLIPDGEAVTKLSIEHGALSIGGRGVQHRVLVIYGN